jgi:hypothetical protein
VEQSKLGCFSGFIQATLMLVCKVKTPYSFYLLANVRLV